MDTEWRADNEELQQRKIEEQTEVLRRSGRTATRKSALHRDYAFL